jgi:glucose-6-phosphate-specific signal transduction histidine kinase
VELTVSVPRLPPEVETTAYLVACDVLEAAVGRTGIRRIVLDVGLDGGLLVIEVRDDRTGDAGPHAEGALTGARDRVATAQGRLTITDLAGGGRVLRAELPVPPGVDETSG